MNRILIPLDGSEFSAQVIATVRKFFAPDACQLVLYRVGAPTEGFTGMPPRLATGEVPVPVYETEGDLELAKHPIYDSQQESNRISALTDELSEIAEPLRGAGYTVSVEADLGEPGKSIVERADENDIDLIAMTTHGRSGLGRVLFGSVAEHIVHHTSVPVLLLRPAPK